MYSLCPLCPLLYVVLGAKVNIQIHSIINAPVLSVCPSSEYYYCIWLRAQTTYI
jgi:hypothetical protein